MLAVKAKEGKVRAKESTEDRSRYPTIVNRELQIADVETALISTSYHHKNEINTNVIQMTNQIETLIQSLITNDYFLEETLMIH